jgi:hypothetical protein
MNERGGGEKSFGTEKIILAIEGGTQNVMATAG